MNRYYGSDDEIESGEQTEKRKRKIIKKVLKEAKEREKKFNEYKLLEVNADVSSDTENIPNKKIKYDDLSVNGINSELTTKSSDDDESRDSDNSSVQAQSVEPKTVVKLSKKKRKLLRKKENAAKEYTVIGEDTSRKKHQVRRVLPDWLANPITVDLDLHKKEIPVEEYDHLDKSVLKNLKSFKISHFFPIQQVVIPELINSNYKRWYCRPEDICVSAPTGSGKTLAFVVPIVMALKDRVVTTVRCLAVLPVRDLAEQVFKVFYNYCQNTTLTVAKVTGSKTFAEEQKSLVKKGIRGFHSLADIVVATPGRLIDHLHSTDGFSLSHLQFLVIDEADRMMEEIQQGWLNEVEKAVYGENAQKINGCCCQEQLYSKVNCFYLTPCTHGHMSDPLQKLLYSATLSEDSDKIQRLSLFCPKLFTSAIDPRLIKVSKYKKNDKSTNKITNEPAIKYVTPAELTEYFVVCNPTLKPLVAWYLVVLRNYKKVLCFTKSVESSHRLHLVLKRMGKLTVEEFSSHVPNSQRKENLKKFISGKVTVLVCSDAMARGMDIKDVDCVILYDVPLHLKTYIHRVGRTARAGKEGVAITLMEAGEKRDFLLMMKSVPGQKLSELNILQEELETFKENYEAAVKGMAHHLTIEQQKKSRSKHLNKKKNKYVKNSDK
ncbi:ATP-dependent RNA helicase DDX51 [Centruroides vittatus]|uniref:ATP-dependent RNA helicase DDX51 n=1 Tax=Centruroides vittatus TaxID=120091 RepID=UPI00350EBA76